MRGAGCCKCKLRSFDCAEVMVILPDEIVVYRPAQQHLGLRTRFHNYDLTSTPLHNYGLQKLADHAGPRELVDLCETLFPKVGVCW